MQSNQHQFYCGLYKVLTKHWGIKKRFKILQLKLCAGINEGFGFDEHDEWINTFNTYINTLNGDINIQLTTLALKACAE